jgi:hypothetical protein
MSRAEAEVVTQPADAMRHLAGSCPADGPANWIVLNGEDKEWKLLSLMKCYFGGSTWQRDV